ncbi:MAG: hypothetical protein NVS4B11_19610 [Ktedonobacteraceae bacterium]
MAWQISGRFIELCSCEMFCPCWFGPAEPDRGWCSGAILADIQQGNSDGVNLGGRRVTFVGDWPKDFASGNGIARLYIDDGADTDQNRALEAIFTGKKGGPWAVLASAVITQWLPTLTTNIEIQWGDSPSVRVGDFGQGTLQPVKNPGGKPTTLQGAAAMSLLELETLELARSDGSQWSNPEMRKWESGGSGDMSTFKWKG